MCNMLWRSKLCITRRAERQCTNSSLWMLLAMYGFQSVLLELWSNDCGVCNLLGFLVAGADFSVEEGWCWIECVVQVH